MSRARNAELLDDIRKQFQEYDSFVLTDYKGLNVEGISLLRRQLSEGNARYKVVKNKLVKIVLKECGIEGLDEYLVGSSAFVFVKGDLLHSSKVLLEYSQSGKIRVKQGYTEGALVGQGYITRLSKLPSKEIVLATLLSALQSPLRGFVGTMKAPLQRLCLVLQEICKQKSKI